MTISWDKIKPNDGSFCPNNLDDGNKNLIKCISCDSRFTKSEIYWKDEEFGRGYRSSIPVANQPKCKNCNSRIISSIVNFGDPIPEKESEFSHSQSKQSDVFMVLGSSLVVNPAAGYPRMTKKNGATLIIINESDTALDKLADFKLDADCNVMVPKILEEVINQIFPYEKINNKKLTFSDHN